MHIQKSIIFLTRCKRIFFSYFSISGLKSFPFQETITILAQFLFGTHAWLKTCQYKYHDDKWAQGFC